MKRVLSFLKSRRFRRVVLVLVFLFILFEVGLAAVIHQYGLTDRTQPADAIVVLGAGLNPDNTPTPSMIRRADHAATLLETGVAPYIICSGGYPGRATVSEASACKTALLAAGVPAEVIILEEASRSTEENALETQKIMHANGWQTAVIVSDGYHLLRASWLFQMAGITGYPSPVTESYPTPTEYLISVLREMAALHWQVIKGLFGIQATFVGGL
ncbi:MAG: YdcF family protein [Anaerolineaceae bacterium]|nr:YdcF family protein [Anaerolineaceae bacterium]